MIYSPTTYGMGDVQVDPQKAEETLKAMRASLAKWLKIRAIRDEYAEGKRKPAKAVALSPSQVAATLRPARFYREQNLAEKLHSLLVESGVDPKTLPSPDVSADPDAAAKLGALVIEGKYANEVSSPQAQGIIWLVAIPVAGAVILLSQKIKSDADLAQKKEELECIKQGLCTDYGFWLKVASVSVIAWLVWGLKEKMSKR